MDLDPGDVGRFDLVMAGYVLQMAGLAKAVGRGSMSRRDRAAHALEFLGRSAAVRRAVR
jgi:hypothetical protein